MRLKKACPSQGFSLIEIMMASALFMVVVLAVSSLFKHQNDQLSTFRASQGRDALKLRFDSLINKQSTLLKSSSVLWPEENFITGKEHGNKALKLCLEESKELDCSENASSGIYLIDPGSAKSAIDVAIAGPDTENAVFYTSEGTRCGSGKDFFSERCPLAAIAWFEAKCPEALTTEVEGIGKRCSVAQNLKLYYKLERPVHLGQKTIDYTSRAPAMTSQVGTSNFSPSGNESSCRGQQKQITNLEGAETPFSKTTDIVLGCRDDEKISEIYSDAVVWSGSECNYDEDISWFVRMSLPSWLNSPPPSPSSKLIRLSYSKPLANLPNACVTISYKCCKL
jgi:hypothetical protein